MSLFFLSLLLFLPARASVKVVQGDVNGDGIVNQHDVMTLIEYLLSGDGSGVVLDNAEVYQDGRVNIDDVTGLIDLLLRGQSQVGQVRSFTVGGVTFNMVVVEGGTFAMGATVEQGDDMWEDEMPVHQVAISTYCIGQTEVTQALWQAVMGVNPSYFTSALGYDDDLQRPVEWVSWDDCQEFIAELNRVTGMAFRLPTEAEWEFAARGGNESNGYEYAGSNVADDVAWYWIGQSTSPQGVGTHPVASKLPNELGLYDMSGNVWEWCQDWYGSYDGEMQDNPCGPTVGEFKVYRGGGWVHDARYCRVSSRNYGPLHYTAFSLGLRLAL